MNTSEEINLLRNNSLTILTAELGVDAEVAQAIIDTLSTTQIAALPQQIISKKAKLHAAMSSILANNPAYVTAEDAKNTLLSYYKNSLNNNSGKKLAASMLQLYSIADLDLTDTLICLIIDKITIELAIEREKELDKHFLLTAYQAAKNMIEKPPGASIMVATLTTYGYAEEKNLPYREHAARLVAAVEVLEHQLAINRISNLPRREDYSLEDVYQLASLYDHQELLARHKQLQAQFLPDDNDDEENIHTHFVNPFPTVKSTTHAIVSEPGLALDNGSGISQAEPSTHAGFTATQVLAASIITVGAVCLGAYALNAITGCGSRWCPGIFKKTPAQTTAADELALQSQKKPTHQHSKSI
jgi:hypothetical protein